MAGAGPTVLGNNMHGNTGEGPDGEEDLDARKIVINGKQEHTFISNYISTGKYSVMSFIFAFLYEQFRRYSNCFFLAIGLLQQIPDVSPTGRWTTIVPLIVILLVSAVKEIIEDMKRHDADKEINNREVEVLSQGEWKSTKWMNVGVGDFVRVKNEKAFPADLILFSSSDVHGLCYIETANLDGETNLKVRQGLHETISFQDTSDYVNLTGMLSCEPPNRHLYEFVGNLVFNRGRELPLKPDQLLLRGARLQNTNWIIGMVIYTGPETKLMMNSTAAPLKRSTLDKQTNTQIIFLFGLLVVVSLISSLFSLWWMDHKQIWYIPPSSNTVNAGTWKKFMVFVYNFLTFLILYNNLIPISLTVTLEIVRFIQALFINWDDDLRYSVTDTPALARTSNLNEELGQVRYVFSDKTGTLTRNIMEFKACTVAGIIYSPDQLSSEDNILLQNLNQNHETAEDIRDFLVLMSVCHSVIPDYTTGELIYHAASPDERALVLGAKSFGYEFVSRTPKTVEINAAGTKEVYEILNILEFTSTRKRMSVMVKTPGGKIQLFCKGADSVIYERLAEDSSSRFRVKNTKQHLHDFSSLGLRTLCCAVADISQEAYQEWNEIFRRAAASITNREAKLEDASNLIERNFRLLGATAIEDKLQENVPETIEALLMAGIHVWVLTGDKQETAINIGHSCRLLGQSMKLLIINCDNVEETRESLSSYRNALGITDVDYTILPPETHNAAVIIDGSTLRYAIVGELRKMFIQLCCSCKAVICCRASPLQKAEIVEYVTTFTGKVTLAIGDGANDVAMIQKAHVGIGISGEEGLQASCSSDYAIAQFHFLRKLLFVHGAWNYDRMCKVIFYSYYKNICLYIIELWFAIYSAWSGQIIFERWTIGLYNMIFTCAQPICIGIFERNCSEQLRLKYPVIYHSKENPFRLKCFFAWIINSIVHSAIIFYVSWWMYGNGVVWSDGSEGGYLVLGNFIYTYVVVVVSIKSALVTKSWTLFTHLSVWGSILLWIVFLLLYSHLYNVISFGAEIFGIGDLVFSSPVFWAGMIIVPSVALLPDFVMLTVESTLNPPIAERFRQCDILHKDPSVFLDKGKLQQVEECVCPSDYSFFDLNSASNTTTTSISGQSSNNAISSPEDGKGIPSSQQSENIKKEANKFINHSNKPVEESGEKPTNVLEIKQNPKQESRMPTENATVMTEIETILTMAFKRNYSKMKKEEVKKVVQPPPAKQSLDNKTVQFSFRKKEQSQKLKRFKTKPKTPNEKTAPSLHSSVHPSLLRTRTKLKTVETTEDGRKAAELRQMLYQQWFTSNNGQREHFGVVK